MGADEEKTDTLEPALRIGVSAAADLRPFCTYSGHFVQYCNIDRRQYCNIDRSVPTVDTLYNIAILTAVNIAILTVLYLQWTPCKYNIALLVILHLDLL